VLHFKQIFHPNNLQNSLFTSKKMRVVFIKEQGCVRREYWPKLRQAYRPEIGVEGLRKTNEILRHDVRSPGREINPVLPEYEA
jgi:hypothetical protein